jgi:ligand-binding sensor domain-containing protein/two-component sensor histidine kinase
LLATRHDSQSSHHIFEHLTTDQGLSSNKVESILQDHDGFYWIATQNGLNRFDGTNFRVYLNNVSDSSSISNNYCTDLVEGMNGDIWVATYQGLNRYIKSTGSFQRIYLSHPTRNFEITNRIYRLAVDQQGNIWIAGNGLWKYDIKNDSVYLFQHNPSDPKTIPAYSLITKLIFDNRLNGVWFITGNELAFYSSDQHQFYHKQNNLHGWKVFDHADSRELEVDKKNRLWFRDKKLQALAYFESDANKVTITSKKVNLGIKQIRADDKNRIWIFYWQAKSEIYDPETMRSDTSFFLKHHSRSALSEVGTYLFIDQFKNYWIASGQGISIYNDADQFYKIHSLRATSKGNVPVKIIALAQTEKDRVWIATNTGLFNYNLRQDQSRFIKIKSPVKAVNALCADGRFLWLGIFDHLVCLDTEKERVIKNFLIGPGIYYIRKGNANDLWIGLWTGGLFHMDLDSFKLNRFKKEGDGNLSIKSNSLITGLPDGNNFWVGYNAGLGFSKYSTTDHSWLHFHPQKNDPGSNAGTTTVITKDSAGILWIGTHGGGIFQFNPEKNTFINFQQQDGLKSNYINSIIPDQNGNLWISTADGVNFKKANAKNLLSPGVGLVFPDNDFAANGIRGLDGHIYMFCRNEFLEINPSAYVPDQAFPKMVISQFKVFDHEIPFSYGDGELDLTYKQNFFSFDFSSIKSQPLQKVNYAYKLEGFDKYWNDGNKQYAAFTNVPDGHYVFRVKATNSEGIWSEDLLTIPLSIKPPYWRTWWFITIICGSILFLAYSFYRYRIAQVKKIYSVRTQISRDLHDDIGASLSSINIYSTVAESEVMDNPDKAREILQQINVNSRQVMENISDIVWANRINRTEDDTLSSRIKNYGYELLTQKNIDCHYMIDPALEKRLTSPEARKSILLIIKEALNNIAKYSQATNAEVKIQLKEIDLNIQIVDNGVGFNLQGTSRGNGLIHMKQRTELLGGRLLLTSSHGYGTKIQVKIPVANISDKS